MRLFNIFRKTRHETESDIADILIPKVCKTQIPPEIASAIDHMNWEDFETAYGNAERTIPFYLKNLFCEDTAISMDATHQLWCSLCHQHAFISSAALPSYEVLRTGLVRLEDKLKIELLDIIEGFASCTSSTFGDTPRQSWEMELRRKLIADIALYRQLSTHPNDVLSNFASSIVINLTPDIDLPE